MNLFVVLDSDRYIYKYAAARLHFKACSGSIFQSSAAHLRINHTKLTCGRREHVRGRIYFIYLIDCGIPLKEVPLTPGSEA